VTRPITTLGAMSPGSSALLPDGRRVRFCWCSGNEARVRIGSAGDLFNLPGSTPVTDVQPLRVAAKESSEVADPLGGTAAAEAPLFGGES